MCSASPAKGAQYSQGGILCVQYEKSGVLGILTGFAEKTTIFFKKKRKKKKVDLLICVCYVPLVPGHVVSLSICFATSSQLLLSVTSQLLLSEAAGNCLLLPREEVSLSVLAGEVSLSTSRCFHWSSGICCAQSGMFATGNWKPAIADFTLDRWARKERKNQLPWCKTINCSGLNRVIPNVLKLISSMKSSLIVRLCMLRTWHYGNAAARILYNRYNVFKNYSGNCCL